MSQRLVQTAYWVDFSDFVLEVFLSLGGGVKFFLHTLKMIF